jgi:hypothetical protein
LDAEDREQFARIAGTSAYRALTAEPNLFVPVNNARYAEMADKAAIQPERARHDFRKCPDGVGRDGVWVPLSWWQEGYTLPAASPRFEELSRKYFDRHKAEGVAISGQPVSRELAKRLGLFTPKAEESAAD